MAWSQTKVQAGIYLPTARSGLDHIWVFPFDGYPFGVDLNGDQEENWDPFWVSPLFGDNGSK